MIYATPISLVGMIFSSSASVSLPGWLVSQLSTHSVTVNLMVAGSNLVFDLPTLAELSGAFVAGGGSAPQLPPMKLGVLQADCSKTLAF